MEMLTVKQVAAVLSVSERSVWRWSATGVLPPGIKIGSVVRCLRSSVLSCVKCLALPRAVRSLNAAMYKLLSIFLTKTRPSWPRHLTSSQLRL